MENRTMKPSEESIPLITSYRLPRHRSRFFRTPLSYSPSNLCMQKGLTSLQVLSLYQQLPISPLRSRFTIFCASLRSFKRCSPPIPVTRPYRKPRHMKKDTYICKCLFLYQQLPILPGRFRPSTFGVCELNFRVRHGYGWSSQLSPLFLWEPVLSKPYRRSPEVIRLSRCS